MPTVAVSYIDFEKKKTQGQLAQLFLTGSGFTLLVNNSPTGMGEEAITYKPGGRFSYFQVNRRCSPTLWITY